MIRHRLITGLVGIVGALTGCAGPPTDSASAAVEVAPAHPGGAGRRLFANAFPHSNGRSCATCHVLEEHTILSPASVVARLAKDPDDPLFARIDADDPTAATPTFEHLQKGLVRVVLPLPDNMDVIDEQGRVITPPDRKVFVWRGVPTVENTAITAPYQYDGRVADLPTQAQGAITNHSQGGNVAQAKLEQIAQFERSQFSSGRARFVAELLEAGVPVEEIPIPEDYMTLTDQEQRGRDVFRTACAGCHGGATTQRITNRALHDSAFPEEKSDGNILFAGTPPAPVLRARPHDEFLLIGFGLLSYLGQRGQFPAFNASVPLPHYRLRFYSDGTRQQQVTDLPPIPVTASGDPFDLNPKVDANGAPIVGPNFVPQWYSTDPGRALITGDPADFEAFDIPSLRGVAHTAPYFHDNSVVTLKDVVDDYSRAILPFFPVLKLPPVNPPEGPGLPPEALSPAQKQDLVSFLNRL
jgi:cytochrome c peroxidase